MRHSPFVAALLAVALIPAAALAAWVPDGTRISPLPPPYDSHRLLGTVADGAGGATVVWHRSTYVPEWDPIRNSESIEVQHIDRNGDALGGWPTGGLTAVRWLPASSFYVSRVIGVHTDGVGGVYVVTLMNALIGDYIHRARVDRITRSGTHVTLGGDPSGLLSLNAQHAAVDADGASGLVFVARGRGYSYPPDPVPRTPLYVQRIDSLGTELWPAWPPNALVPAGQEDASLGLAIAADGAGGAFAAWIDLRDSSGSSVDPDLYVQHVLADGSFDPSWPEQGLLVCGATGAQVSPALRSDGVGGVYVAWIDWRDPVASLFISCVRADGTFSTGTPIDGRRLGDPSGGYCLESDGLGGLYLMGTSPDPGVGWRVVLHRLASDGLPQPGWPIGGLALDACRSIPCSLVLDDAHGVFATFEAGAPSGATGAFVNEIDASGRPAPGWIAVAQHLASSGSGMAVTRSDAGAIVAWTDWRHADSDGGSTIYAQRVLPDGPVPVAVALVSAEASAGLVRVRWSVSLDGASGLAAERRVGRGDWSVIERPLPDGDGRVEVTDSDVQPGTRYAYRLTWSDSGVTRASTPVWVSVPGTASLALAVGPNPAGRSSEVRFTLPRAGAATVTVHDVTGRRVRELARETFDAGEHTCRWDVRDDAGHAVGAGLYLVRLGTDRGVMTRKLAITR